MRLKPETISAQKEPADDRGLTLLELVVAVFVLAMGTLTVLSVVNQSRIGIGEERARLLAAVVADNRVEALRLLPQAPHPQSVDMAGMRFEVSQTLRATAGGLSEVTVVVRAPGGVGAQRVAYLGPRGAGG